MTDEEILRRRFWLIKNFDWFMDEALFHKDNSDFFRGTKLVLWTWDAEEGKVQIP